MKIHDLVILAVLSGLLLISQFVNANDFEGPIPLSERSALIALYNSTSGHRWLNRENWLDAPGTECRWYGISCKPLDTSTKGAPWHVYGIHLSNNDLDGYLPAALADLPELSHLYLMDNALKGNLPIEFDNLQKLEELLIHGNRLSGNLPPKILERFETGTLRLLGYAGQFSPIVQIELKYNPSAAICGNYHATLKPDGSATLKTKLCRMKGPNDRATYWETKRGYIDRYTGDFDRLARSIESLGFYKMDSKYSKMITHGGFEYIVVTHNDGMTITVEDYASAGPMKLWVLKRLIAGTVFNADWGHIERTKPQNN